MLTERIKLYVAHNHHVRAFVGEDGIVDDDIGILTIAACGIDHGFGCTHGGLDKPFALHVLAEQSDDGLVVTGYLCDGLVGNIGYLCAHVMMMIGCKVFVWYQSLGRLMRSRTTRISLL